MANELGAGVRCGGWCARQENAPLALEHNDMFLRYRRVENSQPMYSKQVKQGVTGALSAACPPLCFGFEVESNNPTSVAKKVPSVGVLMEMIVVEGGSRCSSSSLSR